MKSIIIYYSQTGNTEKVARAIQTGIIQVTGQCDLVKIQDANPRRLYEYDLIGLGSPCFGKEPFNVAAFINNMRSVGGKHAFVFTTHGGSPVHFFPSIYPKLKRRGLTIIGMGDWYGDCYLLHHIEPYPTKGHPDEIDLQEAETFGREIVMRSWKIAAGEISLIPSEPHEPEQLSAEKVQEMLTADDLPDLGFGENLVLVYRSKLKFHKEKCLYPKCRLCVDNCPMNGIDLSVDPPIIAKPCHPCEFCSRVCPTGAIDITEWLNDWAIVTLKNLYPQVLFPQLEKAESEGTFRRLLPKDKIVLSLDNFGYKRHTKHPQWIIGKGAQ